MSSRFLLRGSLVALIVLALAVCSAAQLSGSYTIDPAGSGSTNFTTWSAAIAALGAGVGGPVVFTVASTTFNETLAMPAVSGASATNTITFVANGSPATITAGANTALTLNSSKFMIFQNLHFDCTGTYCLYSNQADDNTFLGCKFSGGGQVVYSQGMDRTLFDACELDGKGTASRLLSPYNANDSDCRFQNCFLHSCSATGYGAYINVSGYGIMFWNNTVVVNTSTVAVYLGGCCAWSRANAFRNNIVVNLGTGVCVRYGYSTSTGVLDFNDADYNCYYAPNGFACELENGTAFTKGTLAQWKTYFNTNRATLVPQTGATPIPTPAQAVFDDNSIEADPMLMSTTSPYDIHLKPGSPCLDAGTATFVAGPWISYSATATVATDFEGEARSAPFDIGADEVAVRISGSGAGSPGTTIIYSLFSGSDSGRTYQVGSSLGSGPIPIDTRKLELSVDGLLLASVGGTIPTVFGGYAGVLDAAGMGTARLNIPNLAALKGTRIYTAFLTLAAAAPSGVANISNTFMFAIQ